MQQSNQRTARPLATVTLFLGLALALGGCMRVERTFSLNGDGSGTYVLTVGFRQPQQGNSSSVPTNTVATMEAFGAHVQQLGGTYRRYDEQGYTYWSYTRPFTSVSHAEALLQDDPRQYDANHSPLLYHDSLHVSEEPGLFGSTFHVSGSISLVDLLNNAHAWQDATEVVTITMPNGVSAHQGGTLDGHSVTYTIHYNESTRVDVRGMGGQSNGGVGVLALGIALVALMLAGLGVWLIRGSTRKK